MDNNNSPTPVMSTPAIPEREVQRSLRRTTLAAAIGTMLFAACGVPYVMLLDWVGASGTDQGIAGAIGQLAVLAQLPGAFIIEMLRRRKPLWMTMTILHRVLWFIPAGVAWFMGENDPRALNVILMAVAISGAVAQFMGAAWQSWMADLVPQATRGRFWADRQVAASASLLVFTMVWGVLLDTVGAANARLGFTVVFMLGAVGGVVDILVYLRVVEPAPVREPLTRGFLLSVWERLSGPLLHPAFRRLALALGAWGFACALGGPFGLLFLKEKYGISYSALSLNTAVSALSMMVYSKGFGYLMDRLSARTVGGVCIVLGPVFTIAVWTFISGGAWIVDVPWFGAVELHKGMTIVLLGTLVSSGLFGFVGLAHVNMLAAIVPQRGRTVAIALQYAIISAFTAAGAYAGGRMVDFVRDVAPDGFGFTLPGGEVAGHMQVLVVVQVLLIWGVALPLLLSVRMPNETVKFRDAIDRVLLANPFRVATGIHHARILTQPASRKNRFKAVEAVGNTATAVALADLVARMRDPNIDIREAATHSLGKIGTNEAIQALAAAAALPDSDLAVPALRALRICAVPEVAPAVIPLLSHLNIEVVREAARVLGAAGNPAAIDPLSHLLHSTRQASVAIAAAEALSHLGDSSAIYAIIPRMRNTAADCFHRAYATAAADLMGERDLFYKILTLDEHAHGSGLALLLKRLRSDIGHTAALDFDPTMREHLLVLVRNIDLHYEARELPACARNIFGAVCTFSALCYNIHYRDDVSRFLGALEKRDPLFAAGAWYASVLDGAFQRGDAPNSFAPIRTETEALLGVFILASWSKTFRDPGILRALRNPNANPANAHDTEPAKPV